MRYPQLVKCPMLALWLWLACAGVETAVAYEVGEGGGTSYATRSCSAAGLPANPAGAEQINAATLGEANYSQHQGKSIASIRLVGGGVFDPQNPKENNALYQFLNKIHINTRPSVLKALLLFDEGDTLNVDLLAESERILRSLPYLAYAAIRVEAVCEGQVSLLVFTRDVWTTEPLFNLSREGGDTKRGFGFKEGNVLGRGSSLSLLYDKTPERSRMQYNFYSPHLLKTRIRMRLGFAENSDGQETTFQLHRPFYSLRSRWATGLSNVDTTQIEKIRFGGEQLTVYKRDKERHQGFLGMSLYSTDEAAHRLSVGLNQDRDVYEPTANTVAGVLEDETPENTNFIYPWLEYHYLQNRFGEYKNLDLIHRVEDVPLGVNFKILAGYGGDVFGNDADVVRIKSRYTDVLGVGEHHIVKMDATVDSIHSPEQSDLNQAWWGGQLQYYFLSGERHRYYAAVEYFQGHQLLPHNEFGTGGDNGLRGYPLDYQRGDKRLLLTLEKRYITPWHVFNLLRIGAVGFLDAGRAWGKSYGKTPFLANAGFGLRFSSSKAKLDHIAHLDFAFPLAHRDSVDDYQLVMKVESHF